jgi:hypothetical protein
MRILLLLCFGVAFSQDATKTAPRAYQLQFENEWVRVTRVHYGPRDCAPHRVLDVAAGSSEPALFIVLSPARSAAKKRLSSRDKQSGQRRTNRSDFTISATPRSNYCDLI